MLRKPLRFFVVIYFMLVCTFVIPTIVAAQTPSPTPVPPSVTPSITPVSLTAKPTLLTPSVTVPSIPASASPEWLPGLITSLVAAAGGAIGGAFVVYSLEERKRKQIKNEGIQTAIRRLYDEALSNQQWLSDIDKTRLYLRDEAWVLLKNDGYLVYLPKDISTKVANVYKYLHSLNGYIRELREAITNKRKVVANQKQVGEGIEQLRPLLQELISQLETLPTLQKISKEIKRLDR
ncbi:MAG: flagellar FliJ family protein [Chloroflexi bacterium]|nr:flagellar FliJ family protein [Chloroflexota bacterium]